MRDQVKKITTVELERANLSRYLSPSIVESVLKSERGVALGGSKTRVTVLFADIRGYTRLSQELAANDIMRFLNEHFTEMSKIIFEHEGTLDKFIGDSVMAVFGSPFATGHDEANAVIAAQQMQRTVERLRKKRRGTDRSPFEIGIGINTGHVIAGNIGSPEKMDFTVIGDTVNLSARLQGVAKRGEIVVGEPTYEVVKDRFTFEEIGKISLKNSIKPLRSYRLIFQ